MPITDSAPGIHSGYITGILLMAALLALPVALMLLALYRRAVVRAMRRGTPAGAPSPGPLPAPPESGRRGGAALAPAAALAVRVQDAASTGKVAARGGDLFTGALRAARRTAAVYAAAALGYGIFMASVLHLSDGMEPLPLRFLFLCWVYAWPGVIAVNLVAPVSRGGKLGVAAAYFGVLAVLGAIGIALSPKLTWGQLALAWMLFQLLPTLLLLAFLNRRVRAIGPLVLSFMILAVAGANLALSAANADERGLRAVVEVGLALGLDAGGMFLGLILLGFAFFGVLGWLALRWIRARYERKRISDQSLTLDAVFLTFTAAHSISLGIADVRWTLLGLFGFVVYKVVTWLGFRLVGRTPAVAGESPGLLLLRVFALGRRSERLFEALARQWRHLGNIRMIAGPDLVTKTIEPHEFLDFVSGKLAGRFIGGPQALERRLSEMDLDPDHDGRYRVNEFFCRDDSWKMVLSRLVGGSDAVLMDLRGFSAQNAGCIHEVRELINVVPLERVAFVVDRTTSLEFLQETAREAWEEMRPNSPNWQAGAGELRLYRLEGRSGRELHGLLRALCAAARPAPTVTLRA